MFDQMLANMLGIKPEEMQEMLGGMQTLLKDGVSRLNEIHAQNTEILALLKKGEGDGGQ
jgi:hypothetical protein